jgi:hypothetical protein
MVGFGRTRSETERAERVGLIVFVKRKVAHLIAEK